MRLWPFILCFYRTAFSIQKSGLKSSVFRPKAFPQISPKSYRHNAVPNRFSSRFSTSLTNGPHSLSFTKASTHSAFRERSHTTAHTAKQGASLLCNRAGHLTVPHQAKEQPEEADARLWRVSAFSDVAAPLGCAASSAIWRCCFFSLCVRYFLHVRGKGGITTLGVLYMSSKRRTAACQND